MTKQRTALHHNIPGTSRQQTARQDQKGRHLPHTMRRSDANLHLSSRRSIRALGVLRYESPSHDSDKDSRGRKESQRKKKTRKRRKNKDLGPADVAGTRRTGLRRLCLAHRALYHREACRAAGDSHWLTRLGSDVIVANSSLLGLLMNNTVTGLRAGADNYLHRRE